MSESLLSKSRRNSIDSPNISKTLEPLSFLVESQSKKTKRFSKIQQLPLILLLEPQEEFLLSSKKVFSTLINSTCLSWMSAIRCLMRPVSNQLIYPNPITFLHRYEISSSTNFHEGISHQISYDVLRNHVPKDKRHMQNVHEEPKGNLY